jgi:hypothetical protein
MATGFSTNSSNGGNGGHDDGSLTVAQIRAPSTPFDSDTDPFSDFHFSGREEVVTVKDVEDIVEAVKSSFAKFIEVQRSYLDQQSSESSTDSSESKNTSSAESNLTPSQPSTTAENNDENDSSSNGLTEAAVSDIIEAISDKNESLNSEIRDSMTEFKNGITSKLDLVNNEISEKLIESSSNDGNKDQKESTSSPSNSSNTGISANDMFKSFVEFMTGSVDKIKNKVDGLQESIDTLSENKEETQNSDSLKDAKTSSDSQQTTISTEITPIDIVGQENKSTTDVNAKSDKKSTNSQEIDSDNLVDRIGGYFDKLFNDVGKMFSSDASNDKGMEETPSSTTSSSLSDVVNETNRLTKLLKIDIDGLSKTIGKVSDNGIAKSMVEMMVQNSMLQMISSNTVDGMSSMMSKMVDDKFGNVIRTINENSKTTSTVERDNNETSNNSSDNAEKSTNNGLTANTTAIETGKPEIVDISKDGASSSADENTKSDSIQSSTVNMSNDKNAVEKTNTPSVGEAESKNGGGLLNFIGDAFDSFVSLFSTEKTKKVETTETTINSASNSDKTDNEKVTVSQQMVVVPELNDESKTVHEPTVETEVFNAVEKTTTSLNTGVYSDSKSLELAIQRAGLNNENVLHILDESYSDNEALLANFQELIDGFKENDKGVEGATQLGNVKAEDLLSYYLSGRDDRIEEMRRMNEAIAAASASPDENGVDNTDKTDSTKSKNGEKNGENVDGNVVGEVLENRKIMIERFDRLETSLQSSSSSMPSTQTIYMPIPDTKFEVDRIG